MKATEVISKMDLAFTTDFKISVSVREIKKRSCAKYYLVQQGNSFVCFESIRFNSAKKALDYFYKLCLEMNLCSYNHSL